jgi:hypothetical protein
MGSYKVKENEENLIAAILTISAVRPDAGIEEVVQTHATIREQLHNKDRGNFSVPAAMAPLVKQALEEKARREQKP